MADKTKQQLERELEDALKKISDQEKDLAEASKHLAEFDALKAELKSARAEIDAMNTELAKVKIAALQGAGKPAAVPASELDAAAADIASTRAPDLPPGITEEAVKEKIAASLNQLTRREAIAILKQQQG